MPNEVIHSPHGFINGRLNIRTMAEIEIQIVDTQSPQRAMAGVKNMLAVEAPLGGFVTAPEYLARDTIRIATPVKAFECLAHDDFRFTGGVSLRVVKEIDPTIVGHSHHPLTSFYINLVLERDPGAE